MRVRTYGLILLGLIGVVPLICYGYLAIQRSQATSIAGVRQGNQHLARAVAETIRLHVEHQHELLATLGVTTLQAADRANTFRLFGLDEMYDHLADMVVYELDGNVLRIAAGRPPSDQTQSYQALAEAVVDRPIESSMRVERVYYSHSMTMVQPVVVAGAIRGAIVGRYDLVGIWRTLQSVRVGRTKYARLVSGDGQTIAHGNPDIRSDALSDDDANVGRLMAAARTGTVTANSRGQQVVVSMAMIAERQRDELCWRPQTTSASLLDETRTGAADREASGDQANCWHVLIEQTVDEAFAATESMKLDLVAVGGGVLLLVAVLGILAGRALVRGLEVVRGHTRTLSQDLTARSQFRTRLIEVQALADALDEMASELVAERESARKRERLTTFARVAAGLAHDLRLPIEAVRGACDMVNQEANEDDAHAFLRKVSERELPRLKRFVDDLHRLARSGKIALDAVSVRPAELASSVCGELREAARWQGVEFEVRGSAEPIMLDRDLVRRAVLNLAGNGADACLQKGLGHRVVLEVAEADEVDVVEFRVIDTGVGMSSERLAALETGDFQSSKRSNGVGLGLGVVRQVAATHGGRLSVDSTVGVGSTFTLHFPRNPEPHVVI